MYAATLSCRNAVVNGRKEFPVGLTGRVFNTTYKFAATHLVVMQPVAVNLAVTARRIPSKRAAILRIESTDKLENLHVLAVVANNVFSKYVRPNASRINNSTIYVTEMSLEIRLPLPEHITATLTGTKDGACFIVSRTTQVVDSDTGITDFEVFSQVSVREYVFYVFFRFQKNMTLRFFTARC